MRVCGVGAGGGSRRGQWGGVRGSADGGGVTHPPVTARGGGLVRDCGGVHRGGGGVRQGEGAQALTVHGQQLASGHQPLGTCLSDLCGRRWSRPRPSEQASCGGAGGRVLTPPCVAPPSAPAAHNSKWKGLAWHPPRDQNPPSEPQEVLCPRLWNCGIGRCLFAVVREDRLCPVVRRLGDGIFRNADDCPATCRPPPPPPAARDFGAPP